MSKIYTFTKWMQLDRVVDVDENDYFFIQQLLMIVK